MRPRLHCCGYAGVGMLVVCWPLQSGTPIWRDSGAIQGHPSSPGGWNTALEWIQCLLIEIGMLGWVYPQENARVEQTISKLMWSVRAGICQGLHFQRKFHQISAPPTYVPKLISISVSHMAQTLFKLLLPDWDSEWVSLSTSPLTAECSWTEAKCYKGSSSWCRSPALGSLT